MTIFSHDPIPPPQRPHSSSTRDMTGQQGPTRFQVLLESALQAYEKRPGVMLADLGHPLAARLQNCHSADDITALLQGRAQGFGDPRQRNRIFKAIRGTVSTLTPSSVAYVADDVSQKTLIDPLTSLTNFHRHYSHTRRRYMPLLACYWRYVPRSSAYVNIILTSKPIRQLWA